MVSDTKPSEAFHPGAYLAEELNKRGWNDLFYFSRTFGDYSHDVIDVIYHGEPITEEIAKVIAEKLGTTPELWLNLQNAWDSWNISKYKDK